MLSWLRKFWKRRHWRKLAKGDDAWEAIFEWADQIKEEGGWVQHERSFADGKYHRRVANGMRVEDAEWMRRAEYEEIDAIAAGHLV